MDEFFESLTLIQTLKVVPFPVVMVGSDFWRGLLDWIRTTMHEKYCTISPEDFNLFHLTDCVDEAVNIVYETHIGLRQAAAQLPRFTSDDLPRTGEGTRGGVEPRKGGLRRAMLNGLEDGAI